MAWTWRFEKIDGTPATARDLPKETFSSQSDAETWLGESWRGEACADSMMCLRDRPRSFGPGPVGQYTLVKISTDSRRTPRSARPSTSSARVPA